MKFGSCKFQPAQQGDLDGFCGIYSTLNFLFRKQGWISHDDPDDSKKRQQLFETFLTLLHEKEKFTVRRVARTGFRREQIQAAFGKLPLAQKLKVRASSLSSYAKLHAATDIFDVMRSLNVDEAAMVHSERYNHWVLAHSYTDGAFHVDDSARQHGSLLFRQDRVSEWKIQIEEGLVFLNA